MIINTDVPMLPEFSKEAVALLTGLLNRSREYRIGGGKDGVNEIKNHEFFKGVDWDAMLKKEITPPFIPKTQSASDI
jgi:hypothetical protein